MSKRVARFLAGLARFGTLPLKPRRRQLALALTAEALAQSISVAFDGRSLVFHGPTARSLHEYWGLEAGEPETIRWLDAIPAGEVLWDIGANVGAYALYAAKLRGLPVLAFEPSASTYAILIKNIEINGASGLVDAYCLAFAASTRLDYLHMARTEGGHSMHAFGQAEHNMGAIDVVFRQSTIGITVDRFCELFAPRPPAHIKLDVDSIELAILEGAQQTLATHVRSVMVEVQGTNHTSGGSPIADFLGPLGFAEDRAFMAEGARRNVLFRR